MNTYMETNWTNKADITNYPLGHYKIRFSHNSNGKNVGFNKIRITLSSWGASNNFRMATIGILNSGSFGLRKVFLPRDGGYLYGALTPYSTNTYDLGSSSKMWRNIYIY